MPDRLAHAPHLPVASLMQLDADFGIPVECPQDGHRGRGSGSRLARQIQSFAEASQLSLTEFAPDERVIFFGQGIPWMSESHGKLTVIGQEQQSLGIPIEATDREEPITA